MTLLGWISGNAKPDGGVAIRSPGEVLAAILAVNRPTAPFTIRPGDGGEADLVAEWRIVDAQWSEIFAEAGLTKAAQVLMRLDPTTHEVRSIDKEWSIEWRAGTPVLSAHVSSFRGQQRSVEFGVRYRFTEHGALGQVYKFHFSSEEMRKPLRNAALACGWAWRGLAFSAL